MVTSIDGEKFVINRDFKHDRSDDDEPYEDDDSDNDTTIICPHCDRSIYDDSEQCPHCGEYLTHEDAPRQRKPLWIVVTVIIVLILMVMAIFQL
jgi:predicted nucleic acid-binding Zn ribbon protein